MALDVLIGSVAEKEGEMSSRMEQVVSILWRAMKVMPVVGYVFVLAGAPLVLKRKGVTLGLLVVILDILPVICLIKAAIEVYYGDIIPDRFGPDHIGSGQFAIATKGQPATL